MSTHLLRLAKLVAALTVSALLTGCSSLVPFTHEIRTQHDLSNEDVTALQFYVSRTVKLRREVRSVGRQIENGNLRVVSGKIIEEIELEEHTPGVAVEVGATAIEVSFSESSSLLFSLRTGEPLPLRQEPPSLGSFAEPPNPFPGDRPHHHDHRTLLSPELAGNYWLDSDGDAQVEFEGRMWEAVEGSYGCYLMIDSESLEEVIESETVLGGRRVSNTRPLRIITF